MVRKGGWPPISKHDSPTMNTQKVPGQVPLTMAGPRERAGLMLHPPGEQQPSH